MLLRREDDVDWLDVAMDRPLAVGVRERIGDRSHNAGGLELSSGRFAISHSARLGPLRKSETM